MILSKSFSNVKENFSVFRIPLLSSPTEFRSFQNIDGKLGGFPVLSTSHDVACLVAGDSDDDNEAFCEELKRFLEEA